MTDLQERGRGSFHHESREPALGFFEGGACSLVVERFLLVEHFLLVATAAVCSSLEHCTFGVEHTFDPCISRSLPRSAGSSPGVSLHGREPPLGLWRR